MQRVNTSYHSPRIQVPMNWGTNGTVFQKGGGTNPFSVAAQDPNTLAFPVWYATGRAGIDGIFTVALTNGFTPPVTLTFWEYNKEAAKALGETPTWIKLGPAAANYNIIYDATFAQASVLVSENAYILVQSSAAITGPALMDMMIDFNSVGARQEG